MTIFHVEIHIKYSCTYMLGCSGAYASSRENFENLVQLGVYFEKNCVLKNFLKIKIFYTKHIFI